MSNLTPYQGRPKGAVSLTSRLNKALSRNQGQRADELVEATIVLAILGNPTAMKMVWERCEGLLAQTIQVHLPESEFTLRVGKALHDAISKRTHEDLKKLVELDMLYEVLVAAVAEAVQAAGEKVQEAEYWEGDDSEAAEGEEV